nr:cytochrome P450 [Agasicles hygrophila]
MSILVLLLILILNFCFKIFKINSALSNIPGPPPIPFFGYKLPKDVYEIYTMYNELFLKYGATFKLYAGNTMSVMTSDVKLIEAILKSTTHITKSNTYDLFRPWLNDGLILSDGQKWKNRRKICTPSFHFKIIKNYLEIFKDAAENMANKLRDFADTGTEIDIMEFSSGLSLDVICESAFGVKMNIQLGHSKEYSEAINSVAEISYKRIFSMWKQCDMLFTMFSSDYSKFQKAVKLLNDTSMNIIKERRAIFSETKEKLKKSCKDSNIYKTQTILSDALFDNSELTDKDVQEELNNFLFAGHDTASVTISFMFLTLSKHFDIQQKIFQEISENVGDDIKNLKTNDIQNMKYLDQVIKEVMRYRTPIPFIGRHFKEDAVIGDYFFPKGVNVFLLLHWLHNDNKYYSNPEKFNPERFSTENQANRAPFLYLPFSAGPRNCIGQKYGMLELKTVIIRILWEFVLLPVNNFKEELGIAALLKSKNGFPIKLKLRQTKIQ